MPESPSSTGKTVTIRYFAILKEEAGRAAETRQTEAPDLRDLYLELHENYHFSLPPDVLRVAVNDRFVELSHPLEEGAQIVFVPPVAGG